jgi:4-diphosphocytidyl-2-C-methyl-D-erythritol kinase
VSSVTVRTPAKINLSLAVGPTRPDGYHQLATVYHAVGLYDHVTASSAADGEVSVEVSVDRTDGLVRAADVPVDEGNLAVRAARLLARRTGTSAGVRLHLRKGIPVAGGLAGGSSDAAAALVACNELWRTGLSEGDLLRLAAELGSDVPFCVLGGTAVGQAGYDEAAGLSGLDVPAALLGALRDGDVAALGRAMVNDLQPVALSVRPALADVLRLAASVEAAGAVVSGSGPTCAFLARDEAHAQQVLAGLTRAGCAAVCTAGPVPGARVVQ